MLEKEKQIVGEWLSTMRGVKTDLDAAIARFFHEDATWHRIGSTPMSGTYFGVRSIQEDYLAATFGGQPGSGATVQGLSQDYGFQPLIVHQIVALEDGRLMVHCESDNVGRNGLPFCNEYCWIITMRGDKIAALYEFCDTALIERVLFDKKLVPARTRKARYRR